MVGRDGRDRQPGVDERLQVRALAAHQHADHGIASDDELARLRLGNHGAVADAEIEHAAQLVLVDVPGEPLEDGRPRPGAPVDLHLEAIRNDAREVAEDPAARDVRERLRARAEPAYLVEIEPRRREQVVALVGSSSEHAAARA